MNNRLFGSTAATILVAVMMLFSSCKKESSSSITLRSNALLFDGWNTEMSLPYTSSNVKNITVSSYPEGWKVTVDMDKKMIEITSPKSEVEDDVTNDESGYIVLSGVAFEGDGCSAMFYVDIAQTIDLSAQPANSYVVSQKGTGYVIDATHKGESSKTIAPASAKLIWQNGAELLNYIDLEDGKISFFVTSDDKDEDFQSGNALIGAYDKNNELLWSWHIWVTDCAPQSNTVVLNGHEFMGASLGAKLNSNDSEEDIQGSFGLFYQWGRKDPFIGAYSFDAAGGDGATMYSESNSVVPLEYVETSATVGTVEYAATHPTTFILGNEESKYGWEYSATSNLWSAQKNENDPCPRGWRVPVGDELSNLSIIEDVAAADAGEQFAKSYGWTLSDGTNSSLFIAAGRRTYMTGRIQNVYLPASRNGLEAQPWEGLYWMGDAAGKEASALHFYFDRMDPAASSVKAKQSYQRANGMQVRCVKM